MWLGRSWPSWMIISARSVSWASIPRLASAGTRPISWVAIDLTLMTSRSPVASISEATIELASSASRAQWTRAPWAVAAFSNCSR
jgi:hypothetical protein